MQIFTYSAKTKDEAITSACVDLGITSDLIDVRVVDNGSAGFLGLGSRPCVIEVSLKNSKDTENIEEKPAPLKENRKKDDFKRNQDKPASKKSGNQKRVQEKANNDTNSGKEQSQNVNKKTADPVSGRIAAADTEILTRKANDFLLSVFSKMDMAVEINSQLAADGTTLDIVLSGDDMGVLIGKRGQTLDALQYLTGQVINKHRSDYVRVKIDTENYRGRRKETLESLAKNIAQKVRRTHKPMALEPMNPYERRIIHSVLQNEKDISTRSEGEEPYRHIVVYCTRKKKSNDNSEYNEQ